MGLRGSKAAAAYLAMPLAIQVGAALLADEMDSSTGTCIFAVGGVALAAWGLGALRAPARASVPAAVLPAIALGATPFYDALNVWSPSRPMRRLAVAAGLDNRAWLLPYALLCLACAAVAWWWGTRSDMDAQ